ncbi:hypothetical protein F5Y06DRAFT_299482 [Hypoxylon sp. FL0890]|nr:hypothetical protein F5Y06DRAFT_299482 [Hypoxylon sp. FL0890]
MDSLCAQDDCNPESHLRSRQAAPHTVFINYNCFRLPNHSRQQECSKRKWTASRFKRQHIWNAKKRSAVHKDELASRKKHGRYIQQKSIVNQMSHTQIYSDNVQDMTQAVNQIPNPFRGINMPPIGNLDSGSGSNSNPAISQAIQPTATNENRIPSQLMRVLIHPRRFTHLCKRRSIPQRAIDSGILADLVKMYNNESQKFGGEKYEILREKIKVFKDYCRFT